MTFDTANRFRRRVVGPIEAGTVINMASTIKQWAIRALIALTPIASALAQRTELLWPQGAPGAVGTEPEDKPTLAIYLPAGKAAGTGVVICPGGGYRNLAMEHEGSDIAAWANEHGMAAFVLKY